MPLILALFCLVGCVQKDVPREEEITSGRIEEASLIRMEINFDPEVSGRLFRVKGGLTISGNRSLPYLLLNATLLKDGRPLCSTRYMMIEVEPGRDCSFEISKNLRIWPGDYSCILDVSGPGGQMASEVRECSIIEPFLVAPPIMPEHPPAQEESSMTEEQPEVLRKPKSKPKVYEEKDKRIEESDALSSDAKPSKEESLGQKGYEIKESLEEQVVETSKPESKALQEGELVGSTTSSKYHRPECRYAAKIRPENRIYFEDEGDAKKQGYSPCKTCSS